jgi:cellulose synthase/poly-beta-1,6-N-acetylglucosamine synthase-like glycosyltransferase
MILHITFWILLALIVYSYLGYTLLLYILSLIKKLFSTKGILIEYEPEVTLLITAYNEEDIIDEKIRNSLALDYPQNKLRVLCVTDGSTDSTNILLEKYDNVTVLFEPERNGKIGAINRGMKYVKTPIVVFCDANTMLTTNSIKELVACFANTKTGCVAGEKQIIKQQFGKAVNSGEGFYWQYESLIKRLEAEVNSVIGAAGELFAIRTELFQEVEPDTLLDDFIISMRIAQKGYSIQYAPRAIATETSSVTITEELKRKVRIAAGGIQSIPRLKNLLNPFITGFLSLQYFSHKFLRWTIIPFSFPVILFLNAWFVCNNAGNTYLIVFQLQIIFYLLVIIGLLFKNKNIKLKFVFVPYYIVIMNVAVIMGIIKYFRKQQSVNWEKAQRFK